MVNTTKKTLTLIAIASYALEATSFAATIPAGTTLVLRTAQGFSSIDAPGKEVRMELANDVTVGGKTVLRAGTKFNGRIVTSRRTHASKQRLSVNATSVQTARGSVPIKTAGAVELKDTRLKTRRGTQVSGDSYLIPTGTKIEFRLTQPLNL